MFTKHQKRSRKTYQSNESIKNHIFARFEQRAGLVLKSKLIRKGGAI